MPATNTVERFWSLVQRGDGCWLWMGPLGKEYRGFQYGHFTMAGQQWQAHRLAYTLTHGAIPDGLVIDHLCRTPRCVRPDHLETVDNRTNVITRGQGPFAQRSRATHCKNGHEWTPENTWIRKDSTTGTRFCRACRREGMRRPRARSTA